MRKKQTFILSLWVDDDETTALRGLLQSVINGEKQSFTNVEELLALLKARMQQQDSTPALNEALEGQSE